MFVIWLLPGLAALCLLIAFGCYVYSFYEPPRKSKNPDVIEIPKGEIYEAHREKMENWVRQMRAMPSESFEITSFDGLKLRAKFYEYAPGAPIELMFHGYRGNAERDLAGGEKLPPNVRGILADCGYSSAREIMAHVMGQMGLPAKLCYPFVKLGARLFGHFDLDETSPVEAVKNCQLPVIFFHGESDDFVPCDMSRINFEACGGRKRLVTIPGAGHGLAYAVEPDRYVEELYDFFGPENSHPQ